MQIPAELSGQAVGKHRTGAAMDAVLVQWYNHQHKHSGLKFVTPAQRHDGRAASILSHRKEVYEAAKQRRPERWSGATRDWNLSDEVWLNPERKAPEKLRKAA